MHAYQQHWKRCAHLPRQEDSGVEMRVKVNIGANSGITLGSRRGLGEQSISTACHWIQDIVTHVATKLVQNHTLELLGSVLTKKQ